MSFEGGDHQVLAFAGTSVRLRAQDGSEQVVLASYLMAASDFAVVGGIPVPGVEPFGNAASQLAGLLAGRGDLDGLRARAAAGDEAAAGQLAGLLAGRGDLDELRARAAAGDWHAALHLAGLLAGRGDLDGLRARAAAGDEAAAGELAGLLAGRGDLDGLRARAAAGDEAAAGEMAGLLIKQGRGEEAERLSRFGLNPDGSIACA